MLRSASVTPCSHLSSAIAAFVSAVTTPSLPVETVQRHSEIARSWLRVTRASSRLVSCCCSRDHPWPEVLRLSMGSDGLDSVEPSLYLAA